jgi:hypothetical protein
MSARGPSPAANLKFGAATAESKASRADRLRHAPLFRWSFLK